MLIFAATQGHYDIVKYLVDHGADVNEIAQNGESPLIRACYFNRPQIAEYLIKHHANLEHRSLLDVTPLLAAI